MMSAVSTTRERLLTAGAEALAEAGDRTVSTRRICELAGVQAPTLYHHFGSKQGLIDAVVDAEFTSYVAAGHPREDSTDPIADLRAAWDRHVAFGLAHPSMYVLRYGDVRPDRSAPSTEDTLAGLLAVAGSRGLLRVPPAVAGPRLLAANVGVTFCLARQPEAERDLALSDEVREAALAGVLVDREPTAAPSTLASAAIALTAALQPDASGLTPGELALLRELLDRLSRVGLP